MVFLCAVHLHLIPQHSFMWLPLLCLFIWLSSLCQSVPFLSSNLSLLLISFRWLGFVPPPITSAHCGLLPGSPALHLFPLWTWLSLSEIGVSYFDFLSPPPALCISSSLSDVCLFIYIQREWVVVGLSGWIDGWQEAMGEGIWAFDGCFCQSVCYLKDWLVPYFKNGEAMLARSRYSPPNCSFNTSVLLMLIDLTHINIILI